MPHKSQPTHYYLLHQNYSSLSTSVTRLLVVSSVPFSRFLTRYTFHPYLATHSLIRLPVPASYPKLHHTHLAFIPPSLCLLNFPFLTMNAPVSTPSCLAYHIRNTSPPLAVLAGCLIFPLIILCNVNAVYPLSLLAITLSLNSCNAFPLKVTFL